MPGASSPVEHADTLLCDWSRLASAWKHTAEASLCCSIPHEAELGMGHRCPVYRCLPSPLHSQSCSMSLQHMHMPATESHLVLLNLHSDADHHDASCLILYWLACRSSPVIDMVPTFTTSNERICLLMTNGQMGSLRIEDAERLQVALFPGRCISCTLGFIVQT